jgi:hypothetical protein
VLVIRRQTTAALAIVIMAGSGCSLFSVPSAPCATAGCPVTLVTQSPPEHDDACFLVGFQGRLVLEPTYGLGLQGPDGQLQQVSWPSGFSARWEEAGVVLLDRASHVVAREGNQITLGGVVGQDGVAYACFDPQIQVIN